MKKLNFAILGLLICKVLSGCISNEIKTTSEIKQPAKNKVIKSKKRDKSRPTEEVKETFDGRLYRIYNAPPN